MRFASLCLGVMTCVGLLFQTGGSEVPHSPGAYGRLSGSHVASDTPPLFSGIETTDWREAPEIPSDPEPPRRVPFALISSARMLTSLGELASIGPDGLYRTSGSRGEREAFTWLAAQIADLRFLGQLGASTERQTYRVPLATETRSTRLSMTISGREFSVPAHALQGHRDDLGLALRFDSDGRPNDDDPDPVTVAGNVRLIREPLELYLLGPGSLAGTIALVDFALMDRGVVAATTATQAGTTLLRAKPEAVVLVTQFSNARGVAHGSFLGDLSTLVSLSDPAPVPTVFVRLEDMAVAGISQWNDLRRISLARMTWDADVFSPASSEYLAFRIPGQDSSRALLLGAHLDSANSPGAMDDGSGVVTLLEAARTLNEGRVRPPVDVYLLWFGSHERGLYGSSVFSQSHSELLDRSLGMLEIDCLTHPLDGLPGELVVEAQPYAALGDARLLFPGALQRIAGRLGVPLLIAEVYGGVSDNSSFDGFAVPNANTIYLSRLMVEVHVEGHLHDPYDDMPLAGLHGKELASMATVALGAIMELPAEASNLRVTPPPVSRAVFVASHTEAVQMTPAHLSMLGMVLAWEGWDVDIVPYGTPVTAADLEGAGLVVVLPVVDYPSPLGGTEPYDESFSAAEIEVLTQYANEGGFLLLANSANRLRYGTTPVEANEDWSDMNALGAGLGVTFEDRKLSGTVARTAGSHPLVSGVPSLTIAAGNGLPIRTSAGEVLARAGLDVAAVLVPAGNRGGEVLALSDLSILGGRTPVAPNLTFWKNLARYGKSRGH